MKKIGFLSILSILLVSTSCSNNDEDLSSSKKNQESTFKLVESSKNVSETSSYKSSGDISISENSFMNSAIINNNFIYDTPCFSGVLKYGTSHILSNPANNFYDYSVLLRWKLIGHDLNNNYTLFYLQIKHPSGYIQSEPIPAVGQALLSHGEHTNWAPIPVTQTVNYKDFHYRYVYSNISPNQNQCTFATEWAYFNLIQ